MVGTWFTYGVGSGQMGDGCFGGIFITYLGCIWKEGGDGNETSNTAYAWAYAWAYFTCAGGKGS